MRALTVAWVAMAILTAGALFAGADEEGSQCSAALRGGADACQATCGAGQTAVCKADGSRVGCFCRDASSEKSGDDHKGHDDGDGEHDEHDGHGDGGDDDGDGEHDEHDGHDDGGDDDSDREHGEHDGHGDGGDDDGDGEHGGEHDGHGDGGHDHDGRESRDGDDGQPGASGNGADSSED